MNAVAEPMPSQTAAPKAAWACLVIAWICFLVPVPGLGLFVGWPLNLVAFILAIVAMSKRGAMAGLFQLLASLIASPIVYFIGLAVFAGSIQAATNSATEASTEPAAPVAAVATHGAPEALEIDATALYRAYDANEVAADQQFKGKLLQVTGTVAAIDSSFGDEPVVQLSAGDFQSVHAQGLPTSTAASLSKGAQITVLCTGAGEVIGTPMLEDCSLQ